MSDGRDDELIGYKRPPKWTRFPKGRSGNPRGRPKKPKVATTPAPDALNLLDDALRKERDRTVKVNGQSGPQDLPMHEVVVRSLAARAVKGDIHAQKEILKQWYELSQRDCAREQQEKERQEQIFEYIVDLKARQANKWNAVEGTSAEPADPWPHPDDVILDYSSKEWHIRGPFGAKDVPFFDYCRAERDAMLAHSALWIRNARSGGPWAVVPWRVWDMKLPKRWQIFDQFEPVMINMAMMQLQKLRSLKDTYVKRAEKLRPIYSGLADKETYRVVNAAMKPLLKRYGYRSLAEFEKSYELLGDAMPWPKEPTSQQVTSPTESPPR